MNLINMFYDAIQKIRNKSNSKIKNIHDLQFKSTNKLHLLDKVDLSDLDLQNHENIFSGKLDNPYQLSDDNNTSVNGWTTNVIWPTKEKMPKNFNPEILLENSKHPYGMQELHDTGINGSGISIGIIDSTLAEHPEYDEALQRGHYEIIGNNWYGHKGGDFHGSMVTGCAVGKSTGCAPKANLYYIAANNWTDEELNLPRAQGTHRIKALQRIIEINNTLPENKKIRFLSCSWGINSCAKEYEQELIQTIKKCEQNGIMVILCHYGNATKIVPCDARYGTLSKSFSTEERTGIPTNGKTTPYYKGGFLYQRTGGASSTPPYIAGVFACACQGNQTFFTRPDWQNDLWNILQETSTESEHGGKIINPIAIRERVTQITRNMNLELLQTMGTQHE